MDTLEKGDTVLLFPPVSRNPGLAVYSGMEATIAEEPIIESKWCMVQMTDGMTMKMPKHWFRKR